MAKMPKIVKDRSDKDMFVGFSESISFENQVMAEEAVPQKVKTPVKIVEEGFLTSVLREKLERALLEQKLHLYKQGMVDYDIKVSCQAGQVILTAVAKPPRKG